MYFLLTFVVSMLTWMVLSGIFDVFHISLGIISSLIVAGISNKFLFQNRQQSPGNRLGEMFRAIKYSLWLLYQIILANLHVFYLAIHPNCRDKMEPQVIRFKTRLKTDFARYIFANSITLTPGTVTIRIDDDEFVVHAISQKVADDLPGEMEEQILKTFERSN